MGMVRVVDKGIIGVGLAPDLESLFSFPFFCSFSFVGGIGSSAHIFHPSQIHEEHGAKLMRFVLLRFRLGQFRSRIRKLKKPRARRGGLLERGHGVGRGGVCGSVLCPPPRLQDLAAASPGRLSLALSPCGDDHQQQQQERERERERRQTQVQGRHEPIQTPLPTSTFSSTLTLASTAPLPSTPIHPHPHPHPHPHLHSPRTLARRLSSHYRASALRHRGMREKEV